MNPTLTVDVPSFVRDINEVKRESGRSTEEMLKYVMILMLQAGRSATPFGKKNRPLETEGVPGLNSDDGSGQPEESERQHYTVLHQSLPPKKQYLPYIPRKTRRNEDERNAAIRARKSIIDRFKKITFRGVARASFGWAMWAISRKMADTKTDAEASGLADKMRRNPISTEQQFSGSIPFLQVNNKLGWIMKISPGIEQRMINSADSPLRSWLERRWQTSLDKAARRRS